MLGPATCEACPDPRPRYNNGVDGGTSGVLDDALSELYQAAPEEFVLVRSRLERALKQAGEDSAAAELRRRRRPHLAAWACNQLVHREPDLVDALFRATNEVVDAQQAALQGKDGDRLREVTRERQEVLEEAATAAIQLLRGRAPKPETYRDNIISTLDAATVDGEHARELQAGTLTQTLRAPAGFGPVGTAALPLAPPRARPSAREVERARSALEKARSEHDALAAAAEDAAAELSSAEMHVHSTSEHVRDVMDALERARETEQAAREQVEISRRALADARRAAEDAADRLRQAQVRLEALEAP